MTKLRFSTAFVFASVCLTPLAFGQQPREKPKELQVLGQYVGDWTSDVTGKPAVWTRGHRTSKTRTVASCILRPGNAL